MMSSLHAIYENLSALNGKKRKKNKKQTIRRGAEAFFWAENAKSPDREVRAVAYGCLAVPYSRMGRPHTTIGATAFHF